MRTFHKLTLAYDVLVMAFLASYFIIVFQNLVFTFGELPVSDIPYYDPNNVGTLGTSYSDRYNYEWVVFVSDVIRVTIPASFEFLKGATLFTMTSIETYVVSAYYVFVLIIEILKMIWRLWVWWFCVDFQFCRNYDPNNCFQKFDCPANYVWLVVVWYNIIFVVFMIFYMIAASQVLPEVRDYVGKLQTEGLPSSMYRKRDFEHLKLQ
jgi:hypothetical protein